MFTGKAGMASNWKTSFTTVINGTGYQHPHTDAGRAETYKGLKIFPFVTLHGFGIDEFSMWLLPDPLSKNNKYGFLHTFKASQMLFMRGDFLHGGVPSTLPRGHMKFFQAPKPAGKGNLAIGIEKNGKLLHLCGKEHFLHLGIHVLVPPT